MQHTAHARTRAQKHQKAVMHAASVQYLPPGVDDGTPLLANHLCQSPRAIQAPETNRYMSNVSGPLPHRAVHILWHACGPDTALYCQEGSILANLRACLKEPVPGSGVDGLPDSAQQLQAAPVVLAHPLGILRLQRSDQRGRCVECAHLKAS